VSGYGSFANLNTNSRLTAEASTTPVYQPTSQVGVTVIMMKAGDPGFDQAFDAQQVLVQYPK
jgi:hypothetical protein